MKKRCKVVMLPTEKSNLHQHVDNKKLFMSESPTGLSKIYRNKPQHLYLLSNDKIKAGDCVIDNVKRVWNNVEQCFVEVMNHTDSKKVIASTDPELYKLSEGVVAQLYPSGTATAHAHLPLPTFSEDFIKSFVEANGIDEVEVEFKLIKTDEYAPDNKETYYYIPKLGDDNTVIVSEIPTEVENK